MSDKPTIPDALLKRVQAVKNKRAKFVLDAIVKNGKVSTEDLKNAGYEHPPRAARDAVELGFALKKIDVKNESGKTIAAYTFSDAELDPNKTGRVVMAKKERDELVHKKGGTCNMCGSTTNLQVDHRIPYEVAGESQKDEDDPYQVLDGICNRRKSWACEHCENWLKLKKFEICLGCYWANPEDYTHVAMRPERRIDIVWIGGEVNAFDTLKEEAKKNGRSVPDQIKASLTPKQ
jgi:hypothetical protein